MEIKAGSDKLQPWQMTCNEWVMAREACRRGTGVPAKFTRGCSSEFILADQQREFLAFGVSKGARTLISALQRGEKRIPQDCTRLAADIAIERLETPVEHRDVIRKALREGLPVPDHVIAEYPHLLAAVQDEREAWIQCASEDVALLVDFGAEVLLSHDGEENGKVYVRAGEQVLADLLTSFPAMKVLRADAADVAATVRFDVGKVCAEAETPGP